MECSVQCFINVMNPYHSLLVVTKHRAHELLSSIWVGLLKLHLESELELYSNKIQNPFCDFLRVLRANPI